MQSKEVRQKFLDFFASRGHQIVPSAPIVLKNDPTLMFTNAGMNQFKDYFLGTRQPENRRIADSQKCLRVSGKHNDLEEVGVDTYHHTMFEMLGNWSFGDYFKEASISWAWELLTKEYKLDPDRLWVSVFAGDEADQLPEDTEAADIWKRFISEDRILRFGRKDNFWEMGDTGPCGPCSEIHVDLRPESERTLSSAKALVNNDHPQVIEIWNLVFIQFNRKADGSLESLPEKHVDTGMGLERLVRAIQLQDSNYQSDLFQNCIERLSELSGKTYGDNEKTDIAFRVIADHVRALSFTIADGQLPGNSGAGYVIRRILRRAVRYGYTYLGFHEAFMHKLIPVLEELFGDIYPEISAQKDFISDVIREEEQSFLRTLSRGIDLLQQQFKAQKSTVIPGEIAFELYDTYGFPIDLTQLIAAENGFRVDMERFSHELEAQKKRSRKDAEKSAGDWIVLHSETEPQFIGYDQLQAQVRLLRYRSVNEKGKELAHLVFDQTPFYAESGGQVGDQGNLKGKDNDEVIQVINTQKENNLIIHICDRIPEIPQQVFEARVNTERRASTAANHSATHLLHAALRQVLGSHVQQKGSLVSPDYLRFDFSHFAKMTEDELLEVENIVNGRIQAGISLQEERNLPYQEALQRGAMALFGEKYGDHVRVITFDPAFSVELCGGTHVNNTAAIGSFRIVSESSVAAGVRRIEAISGIKAAQLQQEETLLLKQVRKMLQQPKNLTHAIAQLQDENEQLRHSLENVQHTLGQLEKNRLRSLVTQHNGMYILLAESSFPSPSQLKDAVFQLRQEFGKFVAVLAQNFDNKPQITVMIDEQLSAEKGWNAGNIVRQLASHIQGGGGGQPFYATAGGKNPAGIQNVLQEARTLFQLN